LEKLGRTMRLDAARMQALTRISDKSQIKKALKSAFWRAKKTASCPRFETASARCFDTA
jgi:hypothetical protein